MSKSVFLDDLLALGSLSAARDRTGRHRFAQKVARGEMSKSVFLDDLLALGSLSAARPSANEDDPFPAHVESRIEDHVDGAAGFVEDLHLLALGGDFGQLALGLVGLDP